MAEVYDHVPGIRASTVSRTLANGSVKQSKANQLERVIALHQDVQMALIKHGSAIHQRVRFRMDAAQQRHRMRLKEALAEANKIGDPKLIDTATRHLARYEAQNTEVHWSQADIDYHIGLYRPDGREFFVEADSSEGDRGLEILQRSLTN